MSSGCTPWCQNTIEYPARPVFVTKYLDDFLPTSGHVNASITLTANSMRGEMQFLKPPKRTVAIECRHSHKNGRVSSISGFPGRTENKETPKEFEKDADQFVTRRRDSTGNEIRTKPILSRSSSLGYGELAALRRLPPPQKFQKNFNRDIQTYYPLHQGPSITVSSADGTTLYCDNQSDTQRNTAAQSLFRAMVRQHAEERHKTLDGHMVNIFGTVDLELEIRDINALNGVDVSDYEWEIQSMHAIIEGKNERRIRRQVQKVKATWNRWIAKAFS